MPDDIREGFLNHSKQRTRGFRTELDAVNAGLHLTPDSGPLLEFLHVPLDRRQQAKIIEHRGPKLGGDFSNAIDGRVHLHQHRFHLVAQFRLAARHLALQPGEVQLQNR